MLSLHIFQDDSAPNQLDSNGPAQHISMITENTSVRILLKIHLYLFMHRPKEHDNK